MDPSKKHIRVVSAAIVDPQGRYLITQRQEKAILPLLWEFPGGKVEDGEDDIAALQRELDERLGVHVHVQQRISTIEREYSTYVVELSLYQCDLRHTEPTAKNVNDFAWVASEDFGQYEFTPADESSVRALLGIELN